MSACGQQLVRQVEALKAENSHLRQELRDNSSHLSKLETETSGMKEVLKHLQGKLEQEAGVLVSLGQTEVLEQLKGEGLYNLKFQPPALGPEPAGRTPEGSPGHGSGPSKDSFGELSRATIRLLEELDRERCFLLNEIEKEEKEKLWYYSQLQGLSKRLDELPHVETFSMQMDLIRQQLEFEAQHIRSLMEERFGTSDEMVQRAQVRNGPAAPTHIVTGVWPALAAWALCGVLPNRAPRPGVLRTGPAGGEVGAGGRGSRD
uniref:Adenomatous polyposis coli N-terminal dimerisation domain-containing protein n=1 Tax=Lynx canadensis TaxID=61383 RepID=A0A667GRH0_LYNCA